MVFLHYQMHSEKVFLFTFPSQIFSFEMFNVFYDTFSSGISEVWFGLNKVLLFVNIGLVDLGFMLCYVNLEDIKCFQ